MVTTYSSLEAAEQIGCSERYLQDQIRAGRFRARKIGRSWRLTDDDIQYALDVCANKVTPVAVCTTPRLAVTVLFGPGGTA